MPGTYLSFKLPLLHAVSLYETAEGVGGQRVKPADMHVTLFSCADKEIPEDVVESLGKLQNIEFRVKEVKFLGENSMIYEMTPSTEILMMRKLLMEAGYEDKFTSFSNDDYLFHVTVAYDCPEGTELVKFEKDALPWVVLNGTPIAVPYVDDWRPKK